MNKEAEEIRLDAPLGQLAGLRWGSQGAAPVLCLHGWLDNAASFLPLAEQLGGLDLVALDFARHGHSDHRHHTARYYLTEYLWDVEAAMDALGWESCHLMGHSLGGAVSGIYSAASGQRVRSLVLLDGLGPLTLEPDQAAERLKQSMAYMRTESRPLKSYATIDQLAEARMAVSDISLDAARLLCERSTRRVDGQYQWRTDPALNWRSPLLMTEEQALDCLRNIEAPVLSITASPFSRWYPEERIIARQAAVSKAIHESVDAHHHFHMEIPQQIAGRIKSFILEQESNHAEPDRLED
jgi:pimeloyl-ACP methyl ester carboxylesterase